MTAANWTAEELDRIAWWLGAERVAIAMHGDEWNEPSTAVLILKRVLEERAAMAREDRTWDFLQ